MINVQIENILNYPIFFESNRVWRLYKGGALLDEIAAGVKGTDGLFPEEWIASTTVAQNVENQQSPTEGLSKIAGCGIMLCDLLKAYPLQTLGNENYDGQGLGVLCKFIDSAIRLPIQCHPDVPLAKKYFNSEHGKTEMWVVLGSRVINGVTPYVYIGFKPGLNKDKFKTAVFEQDMDFITSSMHKYEVKESDVYFIPGRLAHAIGPGVFVLEVQEPTDHVIQPERYLDGVELSDADMWKGVNPEIGLECFDYENILDRQQTLNRYRLVEKIIRRGEGYVYYDVVNNVTEYFRVGKLSVAGRCDFKPDLPWYIGVVAKGAGRIKYNDKYFNVKKGDYFFAPACLEQLHYEPSGQMDIYLISR